MARRPPRQPAETTAAALCAILEANLLAVASPLKHPAKLVASRSKVHEFRVQTRRASAAVILARPTIPPDDAEEISERLRKLRRAAGALRDLEVAGGIALKRIPGRSAARKTIEGRLRKLRRKAERAAEDSLNGKQRRNVEALAERIASSPGGSGPVPSLEDAARLAVGWCLGRLARASRADLSKPASMHRVRRRLRTLRLVIEQCMAICRAKALTDAAASLKKWQDRLGEVNDLFRARQVLRTVRQRLGKHTDKAAKAALNRLRHEHAEALGSAARDFRKSAAWPELVRWCAGTRAARRRG